MIPVWRQSNISKRLSLFLFCALSVITAKAQPPEFRNFINSLESDGSYVVARASSAVESEAQALARINLTDSASAWAASVNAEADVSDRVLLSSCYVTFGWDSLFHVVAYVRKTELNVKSPSFSSGNRRKWGEYGFLSEKRHAIANLYIAKLLQCGTINDVYGTLAKLGSSTKMHYCGVINRNTNPRLIDKAILVIYDNDGQVRAVLSEKTSNRTNLATGNEDSTRNYAGNNALWIMFKE